jgi:RNA polymerase sigma-70 factor (ECF subfamily)
MALPEPPEFALEAALEALHEVSFGWARSCCHGDADDAADVLQTAYAKVLSGAAKFGGRSAFKTWFFGVIRLTALERSRGGARQLVLDAGDPLDATTSAPADVAYIEAEDGHALRRALDQLPARQHEVLHLVFYQDMSIAEAALVMGVSLGSARTHYERAKQRLRTLLSPGLRRTS